MKRLITVFAGIACAAVLLVTGCTQQSESTTAALAPQPIAANNVAANPYMAEGESIIHNDVYSSDVTGQIVPLGIYPEITTATETETDKATPCFFYDSNGNCVTPYSLVTPKGVISGGIAIRDVNSDPVKTLGSYLPIRDDGGAYGIQISYSFVDSNNMITGAATNGHVLMFKTTADDGSILPVFEKTIDVDVLTKARKELGEDIDPNLMSVIMDYDGNLWFTTGGFRIDPQYASDGFIGYIDRAYIDSVLAGQNPIAEDYIHVYRLGKGEGAENGISSHPEGCVILTNQACYLLNASDKGVDVVWKTEYESTGGALPQQDNAITGAGMAWGSGTTPTLTEELVLFTDNQDPINLLALDVHTGEVKASYPIFEGMDDVTVSVENSILVYASGTDTVSTLVCNWFGAGNAGLFAADADSSVQSYSNLYDENWINNGSDNLEPGIERIDTVKEGDTYTMKSVWQREDLCDTSMFKLSTATGYLYGYTEVDGVWQYLVLDWDTGETLLSIPVSSLSKYNNMAVGMMQGENGNALYVPTNNMDLLCLRDRFAYLPEKPFFDLDIKQMDRSVIDLSAEGIGAEAVTWLHSAVATNIGEPTVLAFRVNGLTDKPEDLTLYVQKADGTLAAYDGDWQLTDEQGNAVKSSTALDQDTLYEIRLTISDGSDWDLSNKETIVQTSVVLGRDSNP